MSTPEPTIDRHNAPRLVGGKPLAEALRIAIADDPEVRAMADAGLHVPNGEIEWLDALRQQKLPNVLWAISNDLEYFSARPRDIERLSAEYLFEAQGIAVDDRVLNSIVENYTLCNDEFTEYRDRFHDLVQRKYRSFISLLSVSFITAKGRRNENLEDYSIHPSVWNSKKAIHLGEGYIVNGRDDLIHDIYITGLGHPGVSDIRDAQPIATQKRGRGRPTETDWQTVVRHFLISLDEAGFPETQDLAITRIVEIMAHLKTKDVQPRTIQNQMEKNYAIIWSLFPVEARPSNSRWGFIEPPVKKWPRKGP